ncbi:hypothetical protein [Micromonospora halophytica]|uniref:Uncharacterized protein n=1 Tax=Micromonospora halophytica TaxID=47864 RepID=A0A1C5JG86_9ACTN|nr:hypothetical protein [Micromonospora halophytica]SCG69321.1 hypothetical protein GA0070560_13028 [Micromonospora halophytica]
MRVASAAACAAVAAFGALLGGFTASSDASQTVQDTIIARRASAVQHADDHGNG